MVFSSILFLVYFLPVFLLLLEIIPASKTKYLVLVASILFYLWGAPLFLFILVIVSLLNYFLVKWMDRQSSEKKRKWALIFTVVLNLSFLFFYKYLNFLVNIYFDIANDWGYKMNFIPLDIVMPIGISFFTFESLTYVIDIYRREQKPLDRFWDYQLYIIYFPKLIAGPIVRYRDISSQLQPAILKPNPAVKINGLFIFIIGLAKKVLIANTLAPIADKLVKMPPDAQDQGTIWLCLLAYTFQIYFDFSGYSDMAIGISKIIGINLRHNFNNPYSATSITDFWQRWHISMTSWFRNYLYIPLGGNRGSKFKTYRNLILVFLLSGLWHGAKWSFIFWGAYHGTWLVLERLFLGKWIAKLKYLYLPFTFFIVMVGWLFFKVENLDNAFLLFNKMFGMDTFHPSRLISYFPINHDVYAAIALAAFFSFSGISKKVIALQDEFYSFEPKKLSSTVIIVSSMIIFIFCLAFITSSDFNPFIYFRF